MSKKLKKGFYEECLKCGDRIPSDTNKKMIYCKCGALAVDGCEFYTRIIGDSKNCRGIYVDADGKIKKVKMYDAKKLKRLPGED